MSAGDVAAWEMIMNMIRNQCIQVYGSLQHEFSITTVWARIGLKNERCGSVSVSKGCFKICCGQLAKTTMAVDQQIPYPKHWSSQQGRPMNDLHPVSISPGRGRSDHSTKHVHPDWGCAYQYYDQMIGYLLHYDY